MTLIEQIQAVATVYGEATNLSRGRVSTLVFGDGMKLSNIINSGADLTTGRFEKSMLWFSDNWPESTPWPSDIPRPSPSSAPAKAPAPAEA